MNASSALREVTDFGDLAVLVPVAAVISVWLFYLPPSRRDAGWWVIAVALCMGGTALLKVLFVMCPPAADLRSPSGHTSLSTLVYGGLTVLMVTAARSKWRYVAAGVGSVIVALIVISRVALHDHSWLETLLGSAIGAVALSTFGCKYAVSRRDHVSLRPLLLSVALLLILLHGRTVQAESMLRAMSGYLKETSGITCGLN
jgi:membrane-associated phospholipid phosphatase